MLFPAKKGACSILNANEVHRARNEPKAIPARKEEIRNWGYSITNENKDFIRSLYLPLKLHGMSGSTRMMMMTHITIIPAATKKMNRHPKYSPIIPLTTREARIPVSKREDVTESKAKDMIQKRDKQRSSYYNYYTCKKWGDSRSYDLTLNTSKITPEACVDIILDFRKKMEQKK